jgi:hypothetical protein
MPQATIKLQVAPAPAASRKPVVPAAGPAEAVEGSPEKKPLLKPVVSSTEASVKAETEESTAPEVPVVLLYAAAALALVAFGIQLWTFLS